MIVLLGPSGCGKTTTLRMIAGFVPPTAGDIRLDGASIIGAAAAPARNGHRVPELRAVPAPHRRAQHRVRAGDAAHGERPPRRRAWPRCCGWCKLEAFAARLPRQLSGGQQQRVALARALAIHPRVLLLDEPLSNLDAALRQEMAREIRILQRRGGITTIMVTHDQTEAMALADRLVVMHDGRVQQIGTPEDGAFAAGQSVRRALHRRQQHPGRAAGRRSPGARADGAAIALADAMRATARRRSRCAPTACGWRSPAQRLRRGRGGAVHLARRGGGACGAASAPILTLLARGPGLGPDATPRHTAGTRVALRWEAEDERLFDAAGHAMEADIRETSHA